MDNAGFGIRLCDVTHPADTGLTREEIKATPEPPAEGPPEEEALPPAQETEARSFVLTAGPRKGWTLGQVADQRPSGLQFYVTDFCKCGNIQKASSELLLQELNAANTPQEKKKAG